MGGVKPRLGGDDKAKKPRWLSRIGALANPRCKDALINGRGHEEKLKSVALVPGVNNRFRNSIDHLGKRHIRDGGRGSHRQDNNYSLSLMVAPNVRARDERRACQIYHWSDLSRDGSCGTFLGLFSRKVPADLPTLSDILDLR